MEILRWGNRLNKYSLHYLKISSLSSKTEKKVVKVP